MKNQYISVKLPGGLLNLKNINLEVVKSALSEMIYAVYDVNSYKFHEIDSSNLELSAFLYDLEYDEVIDISKPISLLYKSLDLSDERFYKTEERK